MSANIAPQIMTSPPDSRASDFLSDHEVAYPYVAGAMYKAIASVDLVSAMANAGFLSFYGSGGMSLSEIEQAILQIRAKAPGKRFGINLLHSPEAPSDEMALVELLLKCGVCEIEASAFMDVTEAVVRFRLAGLYEAPDGQVRSRHFVMAKVSRPEVAQRFLAPAPVKLVQALVDQGYVTADQARLADRLPVASDLTVEADSAGHTDAGVMATLLPAMRLIQHRTHAQYQYDQPVRLGAGGGIGTPETAACAFLLGADYIVTGSINQCTIEAGISATAKDMLGRMGVRDTAYAPAGDMFELGARVQVLKKGVLFPVRANRLYELWRRHEGIEQIDRKVRLEIQDKFFARSFEDVWRETQEHYARVAPLELERARQPRVRMAMIFKWYFVHSTRLALAGDASQKANYQLHCGPALGAFNQWVADTPLASWQDRGVASIAVLLLEQTSQYLHERLHELNRRFQR